MTTDEDLAVGLGLLADRLYKPSLSNDTTSNLEIPGKESSAVTVTMTTGVKPFAAESQFVTSSATANQAELITDLLAADWPTLVSQLQAGTQPTVLDPAVQTQSVVLSPSSFTETISNVASAPLVKKVIRLVASRPLSSTVSQSQTCTRIVGACPNSAATINNVVLGSAAKANSVVMRPTNLLHTDLSSHELVAVQNPALISVQNEALVSVQNQAV